MQKIRLLFLMLLFWSNATYPASPSSRMVVEVKRDGKAYTMMASFESSLTKCAAYHYLTDYEGAKNLPGVIKSIAHRQSDNKVRVDRTADERILYINVRLNSVLEYTEQPFEGIEFTQITGDSKVFQGNWKIEPHGQGSTLKFSGLWEPDTFIPLFIIDYFAKNGLINKFNSIAELAEKRRDELSNSCAG